MTRLERSAWTIGGGAATVFGLAAVLCNASPGVAFYVIALAVGAWSMRAHILDGLVVAVIAWLLLTGFDLHHRGELSPMNREDLAFLMVLVLTALLCAVGGLPARAIGAWPDGRSHGPGSGMPAAPDDPSWSAPAAPGDAPTLGAGADADAFCRPSLRSSAGPRSDLMPGWADLERGKKSLER